MTTTQAPEREITHVEEPRVVSTVAPPPPPRERLLALDVFRGMTVAGMLLVNNPGTWGAIYPPLEHAEWHGWTPTDLIFPFFLFIAGITTYLSLQGRRSHGADEGAVVRQILRRGALIYLFGLLMSAFPFYQWGAPDTWGFDPATHPASATILNRISWRWEHVRLLGVLQRIGIAYTVAALLTLRTTVKQQVMILAALLYGYWFAMTLIPVPGHGMGQLMLGDKDNTLAAWLDRAILGLNHIWQGSKTFDPEGPFSTIPAIGTAMLGNLAGRWIAQRRPLVDRINGLFAVGALGMVVGLMWNWSFPINKSIWTSSYVLFTAGMALVAIATCMWIIDVNRVTGWTKFFIPFGVNPMVAFVGSGLMARLIYTLWKVNYDGKPIALQAAIYRTLFASWLEPVNASLAFAVTFVLFWYAILRVLHGRKIILKV